MLIHESDLAPVYRRQSNVFASFVAAKMFGVGYRFTRKPHKARFAPIALPLTIDLGGRLVEVLHLPGYTAGSVALWAKQNSMIFCGDAVGTTMQMMSPGTLPLEALLGTFDKMLVLAKDNSIWWGHYDGRLTEADLIKLRKEVSEILHDQPINAKCGKVKTSQNKLITYKTVNVHKRR